MMKKIGNWIINNIFQKDEINKKILLINIETNTNWNIIKNKKFK